jgi:hydrogenase maturation protease
VTDPVAAIANAVLYEGYLLWPYRRSALKNQRRWTFGGVYPRAHAEAHPDDPWRMRTDVLLEGPDDAAVDVRVRFLQVVERRVARADGTSVDELDGVLAWEEAVEREVGPGPIAIPAGAEEERVARGSVVRSWRELRGSVTVARERVADGLQRVVVEIANETPWAGGPRQEVLPLAFCSTHTVLRAQRGAWVSATDPPEHVRETAAGCENVGTWPVLVGDDTLLSSPIILEDHPRIAPESPGDLFDGGEIDQLLILNILAMTDEEKAEMRATDPRAREILERTEALSEEQLLRLHGRLVR